MSGLLGGCPNRQHDKLANRNAETPPTRPLPVGRVASVDDSEMSRAISDGARPHRATPPGAGIGGHLPRMPAGSSGGR